MTNRTMLERIAREICTSLAPSQGVMPTQWYEDRNWRRYRNAALRSIEEMRKPSETMLHAGICQLTEEYTDKENTTPMELTGWIYQSMLEAALKEELK